MHDALGLQFVEWSSTACGPRSPVALRPELPDIIGSVLHARSAALAAFVLLAGCGPNIRSKEKVQEAILARLESRSGLDLQSLDVTTTSVSFDKNLAYATVAFHPKVDSNINSGMSVKYTLENRNGKWVVVSVGGMNGHGGISGAGQLPPGHPPVDAADPHAMPESGAAGSGRSQ
jgi:hypothetical protein